MPTKTVAQPTQNPKKNDTELGGFGWVIEPGGFGSVIVPGG